VVADEIADRIRRGVYRPGQSLPAQRQLCTELGVTLMTLRQALASLGDEGLIVQQPGRGTFVTPPPAAYRLETLRSLSDELRAQGIDVVTEVLGVELRPLPAAVAAAADLATRARALRLERLRVVGGAPLVRQVSWVPNPHGKAIVDVDFSTTPLYAALGDLCGVAVAAASESIRPGLLPTSLAELMRRPAGTPVFLSDRVTRGVDRAALAVDTAVMLGDRLQIRADRVATAMSLSWALLP
jgi:GntR family transcriptional regulator